MKTVKYIFIGLLALSGVGLVVILFSMKSQKEERHNKQTEAARAARWKSKKSEILNENENEDLKELETLDPAGVSDSYTS